MERILITYGTRPLGQRLGRLLDEPERIGYGSCEAIPQFMMGTGKYLSIPHGESPAYLHEVLKSCLDHHYDVLVPLGKAEVGPLAAGKQLFAEYGIRVLIPDISLLEELSVLENPGAGITIDLVSEGVSLLGQPPAVPPELSGVFAFQPDVPGAALCYLTD